MNKLRHRILTKLAQTPAAPTPTKTLGPVPPIPGVLLTQLPNGYGAGTIPFIVQVVNELNTALHYASEGADNFQKIMDNATANLSNPDWKHIHNVAKQFYTTFLNSKNPFAKPVPTSTIHQWADAIISNSDFTSFSHINPTSQLATKLQGNLKTDIERFLDSIKKQNPVTP